MGMKHSILDFLLTKFLFEMEKISTHMHFVAAAAAA